MLFLFASSIILAGSAYGQNTAEASFYRQETGRYVSRYSSGRLTVEKTDTPPDRHTLDECERGAAGCGNWEGTTSADASDLDLDSVEIQPDEGAVSNDGYSLNINCKSRETPCVSESGRFLGYDADVMNSKYGGGQKIFMVTVLCETREECSAFLETLKGRGKRVPAGKIEGPSVQPTGPTTAVSRPASATNTAQPSGDNTFGEILSDIQKRNSGPGKSTLDQLGKKTFPKKPTPDPTQFLFVAFAQSAGFDANDGWGVGSGSDLNIAMGSANSACSTRSKTMCGDEGYCQLRPGMFGAWASDQKYMGQKAFACNLKTQEEATEQALAWCGTGCKVLWSGGN